MGIIGGIWLALLGALAAPNAIVVKLPEAKQYLAKLEPYQQWMGVFAAMWGAYATVQAVINLNWIGRYPFYWLTHTSAALLQLSLGLLLGFTLIGKVVPNAAFKAKLASARFHLARFEGQLGVAGIAVGLILIVTFIFFGPR